MPALSEKVTVAVAQIGSVFFNLEDTIQKVRAWAQQASAQNAQFVLFPEALVPGYPRGFRFGTAVGDRSAEGRDLWLLYWQNAVEVPGCATHELGQIAQDSQVFLAIGVVERDVVGGSLYCTVLYFGPNGQLLGKHRKLKPTASERLVWGEGDGSTLTTFDTPWGKAGGLICWENYMPLARMALYHQGVDLYLAPTADTRDTWQATLRHIACEGRCFVLGCNQFFSKDMLPPDLPCADETVEQPDIMCRGGSAIVSPLGEVLAGPLLDKEGLLLADLDMNEVVRSRMDFDVVGHYSRPDVFQLKVNTNPQQEPDLLGDGK